MCSSFASANQTQQTKRRRLRKVNLIHTFKVTDKSQRIPVEVIPRPGRKPGAPGTAGLPSTSKLHGHLSGWSHCSLTSTRNSSFFTG